MFEETLNIQWMFEDEIKMELTDEMFQSSKVIDGVRMYPFVKVGNGIYYLEGKSFFENQ